MSEDVRNQKQIENNKQISEDDFPEGAYEIPVDEINYLIKQRIAEEDSHSKSRILYASDMANIMDPELTYNTIKRTFGKMVDSIEHTLGMYGQQSLIMPIEHEKTFIFPTKDGNKSLSEIRFSSPIPTFLYTMLKDISDHMQVAVGDSTTSGIPIGYEMFVTLYEKYKNSKEKKISPAGIGHILKAIEEHLRANLFQADEENIVDDVYKKALPFDEDKEKKVSILSRVGCTSANGDSRIANKVAEVFRNKDSKYDAYVTIDINPKVGSEDEIVIENGFELDHGLLSKEFSNQPDLYSARYENPRIMMFNGSLLRSDLQLLEKIVMGVTRGKVPKSNGGVSQVLSNGEMVKDPKTGAMVQAPIETSPLIIIADAFDAHVENFCIRCLKGHEAVSKQIKTDKNGNVIGETLVPVRIPIALVRMDNNYEANKQLYTDLAVAIGAEPFETKSGKLHISTDISDREIFKKSVLSLMGSCEVFESSPKYTRIKGGKGHEVKIAERINRIESDYENYILNEKNRPSASVANALRRRVSMLKASTGKILIGGATPKEKESKKQVYDDVVRAMRSTITSNGVTLSGNVCVVHYLTHQKAKMVKEISDYLIENKLNVTIGNKRENIENLVSGIIDTFAYAFTVSYKRALYNAFQDMDEVNRIYEKCMEDPTKPQVFNLMNGEYENLEDFDKCNLLVPRNTDIELVYTIVSTITLLITSSKILTITPLDIDLNSVIESWEKGEINRTGSLSKYRI